MHWYLVHRIQKYHNGAPNGYNETIIDPTVSQFKKFPPYDKGRGRGFLTKRPSKRAVEMMYRMIWQ